MNKKSDKHEFFDANLIYDYNEVLELFYSTNHPVFINGNTKLQKTKLLEKIIRNLGDEGYTNNEILYIDFSIPFLRFLSRFLLRFVLRFLSRFPLRFHFRIPFKFPLKLSFKVSFKVSSKVPH